MNTSIDKTNELGLPMLELEALQAASLDYLVENPDSLKYNIKAINPRYVGKAMEEEHEAYITESLKLYARGEASLESIFMFGKHKGKQLEDLIEDSPSYIAWLIDKDVITFDEEAYQALEDKGVV